MKYLLLLLILTTFFDIAAQTVILEREVETADSIEGTGNNFGPNRKHYVHQFIGLGFIIGPHETGATTRFPASLDFTFGTRYKYRWNNILSSGIEVGYRSFDFHLKQEKDKILPDTTLHDKEKITLYNLEGNIYQRFNFGMRGDVIGRFIDIGAGYNFNVSAVHYFEDDLPTGERKEVKIHKLKYINRTYPSAFVRFGSNRFVLYAQYRLGEVIKKPLPDLPKLSTGLQIGLH